MLLIYTGTGKGKTSATVGQAIRAYGAGLSVAFAHFFKRTGIAGENIVLKDLLKERYYNNGIGFFTRQEMYPMHRKEAEKVLHFAWEQIPFVDMLLLDEALYALKADIIIRTEIQELLSYSKEHGKHIVLSGRRPKSFKWLWNQADLISDIKCVKHPFTQGIPAQCGIEF